MGGLEITSIHEMGFMLKDKCGFLFDLLSPGGAAVQSKRQGDRGGNQQRMRGGLGEAGAVMHKLFFALDNLKANGILK